MSRKATSYPDYKKRKKYDNSPSEKTDFDYFHKYKYELNRLLLDRVPSLIDPSDFWIFLSKFEMAEKRVPHSDQKCKTNTVNFSLKDSAEKLFYKLPSFDKNGDKIQIQLNTFEKFYDILLLYLDFKQKEKFGKLKKLRKTQNQLPIAQYRNEIIQSVKENRVILIAGDTGCGKSTQVPQYVNQAGFIKIACTQPRRIACISLAKRVAFETLTEFKSLVGYQIRFEKSKRKDTQIIFITEGLLLRQTSDEETLLSYDVVILDEVHERHLYGDFLIGIMKCLLYKRNDFKLILMSATININLFSNYFKEENIKVIQVPGRLYPIDIIYKPIIKDRFEKKTVKFDSAPYLQILQIIEEKYPNNERGDLLIFLNGIAEITKLSEDILEYSKEKQNWIVLQLHSSLSLAEQDKVFDFASEGTRKCIISTNIAETSVTIDEIRFVIDSGKVNKMLFQNVGNINKLTEQNISQDSGKQRSGRAGRTGPGICYRLYSEAEFNNFDKFTTAEIHLVPLEALILNMVSLGLKDVKNFPFLEKPNLGAVNDAITRLNFHGAIISEENLGLTPLGEALSKLPVDLTIGKMLISSTVFGNITGILCLAAVISVQNPLTNRAYRDLDCQNARKPLESDHGDPITLLNLFKEWLSIKYHTKPIESRRSLEKVENSRQWCRKRGLEEQRFYEVMKLMNQFKDILQDSNLIQKEDIMPNEKSNLERTIRHGELKKLKNMKYNLKNRLKTGQNRRKLKYKFELGADDEEEEKELFSKGDLRDVEFRINYDYETLQKLLDETSIESFRDLTLLKLILCSGFYPQVALADEYNYCKSQQEQLFHTKNKFFISLHPMSYFGNNSDSLKLHDDNIEVPPEGFFSKNPLSSRHQILLYQSLLETTKVYLMNSLKMPALQTMLIFSKNINTNETLTKFSFDDFLLMDLPHFSQGKTLLLKAIQIRKKWKNLLNSKLNRDSMENFQNISKDLIDELVDFMNTKASYTFKRLLKADLKSIYTNLIPKELLEIKNNPFDENFVVESDYQNGGVKIAENVTYCSLVDEEWALNLSQQIRETPMTCTNCDLMIFGSFITQLEHEVSCRKQLKKGNEVYPKIDESKIPINAKKIECEHCKQILYLTLTEILKHKKKCIQ